MPGADRGSLHGGNVGIGTATPGAKLHITADNANGTGGTNQLVINGASNANQQLQIGYDTSHDYALLQSVKQGTAYEPLLLNPSGGNVGIGTTAPAARLSFGTSSGGLASLHLYDGGATVRSGMGINTNEFQLFAANSAHFSFNTGGDLQGVGTNELMRIQPNGNVGIGSTAPTQALDVAGAISTAAGQGFKIRYGSSSFSTGNMTGNGNTTSCAAVTGGTVNFGYTFTSAPYVMISGTNGPGACADCFVYNATSVTTTGFAPHLVNCANGTINTTFSYNWIAIGL